VHNTSVFTSVELPLTPPDLSLLGGGTLEIEGECTPCAGPAAFFRISGTMTSLFALHRVPSNLTWPSQLFTEFLGDELGASVDTTWSSVPEPGVGALLVLMGVLGRRAWRGAHPRAW
jgi:hypothetical protein